MTQWSVTSRAVLLALAAMPATLAAGPAAQAGERRPDRCDADTEQRLQYLEDHLAGGRRYANVWWQTWNGVYGAGIAGARAGLTGDSGKRADHVVSAVKAGVGLADNLLRPPPARLGASELAAAGGEESCAERLGRAEDLLRRNAADARKRRFSWRPHLGNLALNAAGAVIVAEGFDENRGWASGAVGLAVGELRIWSYPWQADGAWKEYQRRFPASGAPQLPPTTWQLESSGEGLRVVVRY